MKMSKPISEDYLIEEFYDLNIDEWDYERRNSKYISDFKFGIKKGELYAKIYFDNLFKSYIYHPVMERMVEFKIQLHRKYNKIDDKLREKCYMNGYISGYVTYLYGILLNQRYKYFKSFDTPYYMKYDSLPLEEAFDVYLLKKEEEIFEERKILIDNLRIQMQEWIYDDYLVSMYD